jgi:hypothetical protein
LAIPGAHHHWRPNVLLQHTAGPYIWVNSEQGQSNWKCALAASTGISAANFLCPPTALQSQRKRPKAALWLAGRHVSSLASSGKVDEPDAETHGMFHREQQRSDRSEKIVALD